MSTGFIPLASPVPEPGAKSGKLRLKILPQAEAAPVDAAAAKTAATPTCDHALQPVSLTLPPSTTPQITLQRDGDRISRIVIQCSCGQTIDLACVY